MSSDGTKSSPAITARGVSKRYYIGHRARPTTLAERVAQAVRHPFARDDREVLWALKNCSFDVARGDLVGIIGRNGAGKSTLLKLLSRITEPTEGEILMYGRVGALLEVGTGFHPELTGRENVYLNGTILGMRRKEIAARFDEIVAFAEVERFLDTPVKHYSSGMYVRLAFAVAAHLEPEILIVDEVLAVGDSEFQRKCIGKMEEVAHAGRTVLFVSHNMQAISTLTRRTLVLDRGACVFDGPTSEGIAHYRAMQSAHTDAPASYRAAAAASGNRVLEARAVTSEAGGIHAWGKPIRFEFLLDVPAPANTLCFSFKVLDADDRAVCHLWCFDPGARFRRESGRYRLVFDVPAFRLFQGSYTISTFLSDRRTFTEFEGLSQLCPFTVTMEGIERAEYEWENGDCAYLEDHRWTLAQEGSQDAPQQGGFHA
jgi:ABC-type polysaccharide/polyol phosphate transport system ATPase subunit